MNEDRIQSVVQGGYCIGCGACATLQPTVYTIGFNEFGEYQSLRTPNTSAADEGQPANGVISESVCPFSGTSENEDNIGRRLFASHAVYHPLVGYHLACFAGSVAAGRYRERGSSGGATSWLLCELLRRELVSGVIHVRSDKAGSPHPMFRYAISRTVEEVQESAKSRYYPIEFSDVMQQAREVDGTYAFVGIPCFVKAVRLLMKEDEILRRRIRYCAALFCGHLKSSAFADAVAWESGIHLRDVKGIDFRHKLADRPANRYGVKIDRSDGTSLIRPMDGLMTKDWGAGLLKYRACDYCDDVVGETADISFGDAWLPQYVSDARGTNVVVVRHPELLQLVQDGIKSDQLELREMTADEVAASQISGFRHRRFGLRYRLWKKLTAGEWFPQKRVEPTRDGMSQRDQELFDVRLQLTETSRLSFRKAIEADDFSIFRASMSPLLKKYHSFYRRAWWHRAADKLRRAARHAYARAMGIPIEH